MLAGQHGRETGRFLEALTDFKRAALVAHQSGDLRNQALALHRAAACQIRLFQYPQALASATAARDISLEIKDLTQAGTAANNRATVYQQLGDFGLAANAAAEAVQLLEKSPRQDYFASALLNYGDILAFLGQPTRSISILERAVSVAHAANAVEVEALANDHLGETLIEVHQYDRAGKALDQALRLHLALKNHDAAALTQASLASLAYSQGRYASALQLLDGSIATRSISLSTVPPYWAQHERGKILLALGRKDDAEVELRRAVAAARMWRRASLPSDGTSTRTAVALHEVYRDYISLTAELGISRKSSILVRNALAVLMESRAATLREQMVSALRQQMPLPRRYFEVLSELQSAQAAVTLSPGAKDLASKQTRLDQLRLDLTELENSIGMRQTFASGPVSVASIQRHLSPAELLLSFCLGSDRSFVWAVTSDDVRVYELPSANALNQDAKLFAKRVQAGDSSDTGTAFAKELLGQVDTKLMRKPEWLIAGDGALLDSIPLSALPDITVPGSKQAITALHSLRLIPAEALVSSGATPEPTPRFVGIADPIYNFADVRRSKSIKFVPVRDAGPRITLARLAGSEHEVRAAAEMTGFNSAAVLSGSEANMRNLRSVLASTPEVLHFAVHVVSPQGPNGSASPDQAGLALSLDDHGIPELLTKETIATLRVPGTLVVLSGCASQQGANLPSAGIIGLSRAWLLAGASAVLVSAWPTPDDSGQFFSVFYRHLQAQPASGSLATRAAAALRQTQSDMLRFGDYRSQPSFWAAYSLISKE